MVKSKKMIDACMKRYWKIVIVKSEVLKTLKRRKNFEYPIM